jgi:microsomal dipeptidase-like Zn-dependent dipeptidase
MYHLWLKRALDYGLKLIVVFAVNNRFVANIIERDPNRSPDDMEAVDYQITAAREMEAAIDQDSGGPGQGWYRIVRSPEEARNVIRAGKLAVVLGIEVDFVFNSMPDTPPSPDEVVSQLNRYYENGIRHIFPIHFHDNAFGGAAFQNILVGDPAVTETSAQGVVLETIGWPSEITTRPAPGAGYEYRGGRVNVLGLTDLGKFFIRAMMSKGVLIDVDHMSLAAVRDTLTIAETGLPYPIVSSHTGFIEIAVGDKRHEGNMLPESVERIRRTGGMVACILNQGNLNEVSTWRGAGQTHVEHSSGGTSETWVQAYLYAIEKMQGRPVGFGSDFNGMINPTGPRFGPEAAPGNPSPLLPPWQGIPGPNNPVEYPFIAAVTRAAVDRSEVGRKTFDINTDGLAHVGMFPDFIADLQKIGLTDNDLDPLLNSAEGYLQMWELAELYPRAQPSAPYAGTAKWSQMRSGFLKTSEIADTISYEIVPGAVAPDAIEFVLSLGGPVSWPKELVLMAPPDRFVVAVQDRVRSDHDGLFRNQLDSGALQFRKAKGPLKTMAEVLRLEDLLFLPEGARVTFTWSRD